VAAQRRSPDAAPIFDHVATTVADLDTTLAYYEDRFGYEVIGQLRHSQDPRGFLITYLAAGEGVRPYLHRWPKMDRNAIVQGWAGVYSSFLLHAERAGERYKVPAHEILRRCGELGYVGGQEDMIIDVAIQLASERDQGRG